MKAVKRKLIGSTLLALVAGCATLSAEKSGPLIAVTIDDLPVHGPLPHGMTANEANLQMIAALRAAGVPGVYTFVNGHWTESQPETLAALEAWRAAGAVHTNHTWSHKNLNQVTVDEFKQEIVRNEPLLERLGARTDWRWFRYPYLGEGDDPAKRAEIRNFLGDRGYRIAGVSMDFSDWQWTAPYARCVAAGDQRAVAELERMYLDAARSSLETRRELARRLYGRDIPHVLLLHVGAFSARMLPRLLELYRAEGVRFVSLPQAQADPAYAEDMNPRLPAREQFIGARAAARGVEAPEEPDYAPKLAAMCPGSGPTASVP